MSTLSAVKKATVAERLLDAPGSSSTGRLYSSNNGAYVKYTVPQKPRVRNRDSGFITSHLKARENEYTEVKPHRYWWLLFMCLFVCLPAYCKSINFRKLFNFVNFVNCKEFTNLNCLPTFVALDPSIYADACTMLSG